MSDVAIRPAVAADFPALAPLLAPLPLFTAYHLTAERLSQRWQAGLRNGDGMLVADRGHGPLGICWYLRRGVFGIGAYLRTLALVPETHGHGLGRALLEAFELASDSPPGGWFLLTSDFNSGAQRFYQRQGYSEVGRLPQGFAAPGIGEVIFWKPRK